MANRVPQCFHAWMVKTTIGTFRQSNQRQGNCMKRSLGKCCHKERVGENISKHAAVPHTICGHQRAASFRRRVHRNAAASKNVTISETATKETRRLKRSCNSSGRSV